MRFAAFDHQGKSGALVRALEAHGHELVGTARADVLLIDYDGVASRHSLIDQCVDHGGIVLVYPHGARANYQYDGLVEPHPDVTAYLVQGLAQVETYRLIGIEKPVYPIGWYYCPLIPFKPVENPKRILFCPAHPFGDGSLDEESKSENARVFRALLDCGSEIHVTLYGSPEENGIWEKRGVTFQQSNLNLYWGDIDDADLVVAEGTKAYLAVARGKPVVMTGQDRVVTDDSGLNAVPRWDEYGTQSRYPISFPEQNFCGVANYACRGSDAVEEWRRGFIGSAFSALAFADLVEDLVRSPVAA